MKRWHKNPDFLTRKEGTKGAPKPSILIVCEGEKTEPYYFEQFKISSVELEIVGTGMNTISLVEHAIELKSKATKIGDAYDLVWCVFDRDSFPVNDFNGAIQKAKANDIKVAYSNEAFEIWYILHFDYLTSALSRSQYSGKLSTLIGRTYQKNDSSIYQILLDKQQVAIRNAKKLLGSYDPLDPARNNPLTTVFELVEKLNEYREK